MNRLAVLSLCFLPLAGWWLYGLFDLDEGFYGAATMEMLRRNEWITPYYNGQPWFEKPILIYWLAKPSIMLVGPQFGARLPSVLSALALYWMTMSFALRYFRLTPAQSEKISQRIRAADYATNAAAIAGLALGTSLLVVALGRMMMTDMPLAVALSGAWFSFWRGLTEKRAWWILTGFWLGVSVLAKGPIGIILSVPIFGYGAWIMRGKRPFQLGTVLAIPGAMIACAAVTATWYWPAYAQNGDVFVQKFLIEQNWNRFLGGDRAHSIGLAGLLAFVPVILLGFAPWSWFLVKAWPRKSDDEVAKFVAACALIPFLFFTISSAKLPHYVLPCFAPLALLVGRYLATQWDRVMDWALGWAFGVAVLANVGFFYWYGRSGQAEVHTLARQMPLGATLIVYQMPRRGSELGTLKPKLQETSLPSIEFVLNKTVIQAETAADFPAFSKDKTFYVITRSSRLESLKSDLKLAGFDPVGAGYTYGVYDTTENFVLRGLKQAKANPTAPP
ncbi:MAG: glycosyltransferase family 39 protein [Fimbriimonadaceae bacterium]